MLLSFKWIKNTMSSARPILVVWLILKLRLFSVTMEINRRVSRVSVQQLEILWEFLNSHRDIATAYNRSLQAKEFSKRMWGEIGEILNSQGDGAHKDWKGWSKYWVDYKAKLKSRVAAIRSSHVRTGGGPSTEKPLTEMENKFLQILGEDFGQGLPGVRVEPFEEPPVIVDSQPASHSILLNFPDHPAQPTPTIELGSIEPNPTTPMVQDYILEPISEDPPARSPTPNPPINPRAVIRSPRRRRHRREPPMTPEAARRALVSASQMRAEAAVRSATAMEKIAEKMAELQNTACKIERILNVAFPTTAGQETDE